MVMEFPDYAPPPIATDRSVNGPAVRSPGWWVERLLKKLHERSWDMQRWAAYYDGDQPLAFASAKFKEAFGERFPVFTSNFSAMVVDKIAERLEIQGFRYGDEAGSKEVWDLWQRAGMDALSQMAHQEALIKGCAYAIVQPVRNADPIVTIEDGSECIVEMDPLNIRKRRAGLKRWIDDEGYLVVVLYLPDRIYSYRSKAVWDATKGFAPVAMGGDDYRADKFAAYQLENNESADFENTLKTVPVVPLPNRPRLKVDGQSEIRLIQSNQDAINKYRCDALIASEFVAYPQRYLLNFEPEVDPETGRAIEPFKAGVDRVWIVPPGDPDVDTPQEPKIGQFPAADLSPYSKMISDEIGAMATISGLPYHYLIGSPTAIPPSGESLKSAEAGFVRKIGRIELFLGDGWEEVMRLQLLAKGNPLAEQHAETIWVDPEARNEAVRTDAVVKLRGDGDTGIIDDELSWEMIGLSQEQIARLKERKEKAEAEAEAEAAANPPPPPSPADVTPAPFGPRMGANLPPAAQA